MELKEAFKIAVEVHGDQLDKSGEPYLFHVMRVAQAMDTDEERCVAILHDVVEDCHPSNAIAYGRLIGRLYGVEVMDAVVALTHFEPDYMDYIRRLSTNPLAVKVKFADIQDNRNPKRLRKLPRAECDRLYDKYEKAWLVLYAAADAAGTLPTNPAESPAPLPTEKGNA